MQPEIEHRLLAGLLALLLDLVASPSATISSMRVGWMRPSAMRRVERERAISRRTGLKQEITTASGVSSMMRSMPVAASSARMLRPSRPMMRPFMSSDGQRHGRDGALGDVLARVALDRRRGCSCDFSSASARASSSIFLTSTAACCGVVAHLRDQLGLRAPRRVRPASFSSFCCDSASSLFGALGGRLGGLLAAGGALLLALELGLFAGERALLLGQLLLAATQRLFALLQLGAPLFELALEIAGGVERLLLGLERRGALDLGRFGARRFDQLLPLRLGHRRLGLAEQLAPDDAAHHQRDDAQDDADCHAQDSPSDEDRGARAGGGAPSGVTMAVDRLIAVTAGERVDQLKRVTHADAQRARRGGERGVVVAAAIAEAMAASLEGQTPGTITSVELGEPAARRICGGVGTPKRPGPREPASSTR